jgi:hypothetical protein
MSNHGHYSAAQLRKSDENSCCRFLSLNEIRILNLNKPLALLAFFNYFPYIIASGGRKSGLVDYLL